MLLWESINLMNTGTWGELSDDLRGVTVILMLIRSLDAVPLDSAIRYFPIRDFDSLLCVCAEANWEAGVWSPREKLYDIHKCQ